MVKLLVTIGTVQRVGNDRLNNDFMIDDNKRNDEVKKNILCYIIIIVSNYSSFFSDSN
jgi:hypothetical protein